MKITVFTPTYNRGYIIDKLFQSLKTQTFNDFEWIIVNDGSTDNTDKIIQDFINDKNRSFPIKYYSVSNGGKHRAINIGVNNAQGKLFFIVDSDDYLIDTALEIIDSIENSIPIQKKTSFAGVCGLRGYNLHKMVGSTFQGDFLDITSLERSKYNIFGDKSEVFYTTILKKYPFPEFNNEKFVTECIVWDRIANDGYKLRYFNQIIYICNYLDDGLTANYQNALNNSPKGYGLYIYQCDKYKKITGISKWNEYFKYYNQERQKLNYFQMSKYLYMSWYKFYFRILGMKIFYKLYDK